MVLICPISQRFSYVLNLMAFSKSYKYLQVLKVMIFRIYFMYHGFRISYTLWFFIYTCIFVPYTVDHGFCMSYPLWFFIFTYVTVFICPTRMFHKPCFTIHRTRHGCSRSKYASLRNYAKQYSDFVCSANIIFIKTANSCVI